MKKIITTMLAIVMMVTCLAAPVETYAATKVSKVTILSVTNSSTTKSAKLKVKWKKVKGASGYQVKISRSKKFPSKKASKASKVTTKNTYTVTVKKGSTVAKTISGLPNNKTYYVKVRAYKTVGKKKVYGSWSKVKSKKIKKKSTTKNSEPKPNKDPEKDETLPANSLFWGVEKDTSLKLPKNFKVSVDDESIVITAEVPDKKITGMLYQIAKDRNFNQLVETGETANWKQPDGKFYMCISRYYGQADQFSFKPNTTYYIRYAGYVAGNHYQKEKDRYGNWSSVKSFKTKAVGRADVMDCESFVNITNTSSMNMSGTLICWFNDGKGGSDKEIYNKKITLAPGKENHDTAQYTIPFSDMNNTDTYTWYAKFIDDNGTEYLLKDARFSYLCFDGTKLYLNVK